MPADPYARIAPWYDLLLEKVDAPVRATAFKLAQASPSMTVLDVGCGTGITLERYVEAGCDSHGIDASEAMLAQARTRLGERATLTIGDATELPYDDSSFDRVLASLFLHELRPTIRDRVLVELARVVTDAGRIVITDYGAADLSLKGRAGRGVSMVVERIAGREHHRNCATFLKSGGIPAAASRFGFEVESSRHLGGGNMAIYVVRTT